MLQSSPDLPVLSRVFTIDVFANISGGQSSKYNRKRHGVKMIYTAASKPTAQTRPLKKTVVFSFQIGRNWLPMVQLVNIGSDICHVSSNSGLFSARASLLLTYGLAEIRTWIINYIHCLMWDIITHSLTSMAGSYGTDKQYPSMDE